ncbi:hypothetical protein DIE07_05995 [Burkholderia sp. Bp9002]|nr:hypothetical protein DIE18_09250 [Burkholderia sp. Bp9125]RQS13716.1 hypothetical protein DIE07_05995 [Burkholderia sp. Bp9002]
MSYWRKFLIVVLLALSLPVQSFAAAAMSCAAAGDLSARHSEAAGSAHLHDMRGDRGHTHHAAPGDAGHAQTCQACASCCVGTGLALPDVAAAAHTACIHGFIPPPTAAASFLTGGIERPPRGALV